MTREQFTSQFWDEAVNATSGTPIFPETVITAAGLEGGWNTSELARLHNNHFGFKGSYNGMYVLLPTKEYINGSYVTVDAKFRKYPSVTEGFKDYVRLLQTTRYVNGGVTTAKTPIEQFEALQRSGYATDPKYASKLSSVYYTIKGFFKNTRK
jgi:flagellum-specific peptidoglycan hydrolase FlgJ